MNLSCKAVVAIVAFMVACSAYGACVELPVSRDDRVYGTLSADDCTINELLGGEDLSKVDVYVLHVDKTETVSVSLNSSQFDAYLYIYDAAFSTLYVEEDDSDASFDVNIAQLTLSPGNYKVLVNSSTQGTEHGSYDLSITGQVLLAEPVDSKDADTDENDIHGVRQELFVTEVRVPTSVDIKLRLPRDNTQTSPHDKDQFPHSHRHQTPQDDHAQTATEVVETDKKLPSEDQSNVILNRLARFASMSREAIRKMLDEIRDGWGRE